MSKFLENLSDSDREFAKQLWQQLSAAKPGVSIVQVQHDDWCKFFTTGSPDDCDCNPTIETQEVS